MADAETEARLESLIGYLADQLTPARELVSELRLRVNASRTTREQLRHLNDMLGSIWERLGEIREEARRLREGQGPQTQRIVVKVLQEPPGDPRPVRVYAKMRDSQQ